MNALSISAIRYLHVVPAPVSPVHPQPTPSPQKDAETLAQFWEVWLQHESYLYNFCLKWTGQNPTEARELLSLAREKAQKKWPTHAHKVTNPKSWLSSLTKHLYIDLYRSRERKNQIHAGLQKEAASAIAHQPSPERNLLNQELSAYLQQIIEDLPQKLREPFVLRFQQEKSYKEVAFQLAITEGNARKRIQQARTRLRKRLRQYMNGHSNVAVLDL